MNDEPLNEDAKQARREQKLRKKRERIQQHGKSLGKIYTEAVRKRTKK